jgi:TonB family protein
MKLILKMFIILLVLMFAFGDLHAVPDMVAQIRLYEGFKEITAPSGVTASYYLKPLANENVYLEVDITKEQDSLKKVFSLKDIKLVTQAGLILGKTSTGSPCQVIVLNGRELLLQLSADGEENRFKVEVIEAGEKEKASRSLLTSQVYLPVKKTTVLGFEDSTGKIYFLSFHRGEDVADKIEKNSNDKKPKLIKSVPLQYPPEAKKLNVQGNVSIEATTDTDGHVIEAVATSGPKELIPAALENIKQWQYEPYIIEGKARKIKFTVVFNFNLDGDKKPAPVNLSSAQKPKLIKSVSPKYPEEALKNKIEGVVVVEVVTDTKGFVEETNVIESPELFKTNAVEALRQWQWEPYYVDGIAWPVRFTVVVKFQLSKDKKVNN